MNENEPRGTMNFAVRLQAKPTHVFEIGTIWTIYRDFSRNRR